MSISHSISSQSGGLERPDRSYPHEIIRRQRMKALEQKLRDSEFNGFLHPYDSQQITKQAVASVNEGVVKPELPAQDKVIDTTGQEAQLI